ncbi:MAG: bacteriohemerythrin [Clostridia bacterium]|nr:bacteriohemerythrin [Clostridia bacterium]
MITPWQWNTKLATGNDEIDGQHKELLARVNHLMEAVSQGNKKEAVADTFRFLETYAVIHFASEENLQQKYGYPEYIYHKCLHQDFITNLQNLIKKFGREGVTPEISMELSKTVCEWLVEHICLEDKKLADFLKAKGLK